MGGLQDLYQKYGAGNFGRILGGSVRFLNLSYRLEKGFTLQNGNGMLEEIRNRLFIADREGVIYEEEIQTKKKEVFDTHRNFGSASDRFDRGISGNQFLF